MSTLHLKKGQPLPLNFLCKRIFFSKVSSVHQITNLLKSISTHYTFNEENFTWKTEQADLYLVPIVSNPNWESVTAQYKPGELGNKKKICIWEDQLLSRREIIMSRLLSVFGHTTKIHGRQTTVSEVTKGAAKDFLIINHLNVPVIGKYRLGLSIHDELVALAVFGRACPIHRKGNVYNSHELIRYCSKLRHTITGGLSKLLAHFIEKAGPDDVMSYADREWSNGSTYLTLGFEMIDTTVPQTFWLPPDSMERLYSNQIPKLKKEELFGSGWKEFSNSGNWKLVKLLK